MSAAQFEVEALYRALDEQRIDRGLGRRGAADQIWELSAELNLLRHDHPISPATLTGVLKRGDCTCQHALFLLRWLGRTPESFLKDIPQLDVETALPVVGPELRLRWDLAAVYNALNLQRLQKSITWGELAAELRCTENQLTGIRTARFAIGMRLAMRMVLWLEVPARTFVYGAKW